MDALELKLSLIEQLKTIDDVKLLTQIKNLISIATEKKETRYPAQMTLDELKEVLTKNNDIFILGGGSNMLLTQDIQKLVVHVNLKGREIVEENDDFAPIQHKYSTC